jgi:hypothetical protein
MVPCDKQVPPHSDAEAEPDEEQGGPWPIIVMALLVLGCLASLVLLDIRIASLLCMAACAIVRYIAARDDPG